MKTSALSTTSCQRLQKKKDPAYDIAESKRHVVQSFIVAMEMERQTPKEQAEVEEALVKEAIFVKRTRPSLKWGGSLHVQLPPS